MYNPLIVVEKFLDDAIESGNIKWYLIGLIGIVLYFIIY